MRELQKCRNRTIKVDQEGKVAQKPKRHQAGRCLSQKEEERVGSEIVSDEPVDLRSNVKQAVHLAWKFQVMSNTPASMFPSFNSENKEGDMSRSPSEHPGHRSATNASAVRPFWVLVMLIH